MVNVTPAEAQDIARAIVLGLCGNRWSFPIRSVVDEYPVPVNGRISVQGRPIVSVESVTASGKVLAPDSEWRVINATTVQLLGAQYDSSSLLAQAYRARSSAIYMGRGFGPGSKVEIAYTYGVAELPRAIQNAIDTLTEEIAKAWSGDATCRLPRRTTSVNRQGVSYTLIDPQDFLDAGRTGLIEVDLIIKAYNPRKARARVRLFTPTNSAPATRRTQ